MAEMTWDEAREAATDILSPRQGELFLWLIDVVERIEARFDAADAADAEQETVEDEQLDEMAERLSLAFGTEPAEARRMLQAHLREYRASGGEVAETAALQAQPTALRPGMRVRLRRGPWSERVAKVVRNMVTIVFEDGEGDEVEVVAEAVEVVMGGGSC